MPWVAWLSTLLAFLGPAAFLAFGRRIRDVTRRGLGRRGGVLLCLRQFVLDSDKLLLQLSDSRRQFIAVLASVRRSGHRDQNLRQSAKCPYTNSQPVNGYPQRQPPCRTREAKSVNDRSSFTCSWRQPAMDEFLGCRRSWFFCCRRHRRARPGGTSWQRRC